MPSVCWSCLPSVSRARLSHHTHTHNTHARTHAHTQTQTHLTLNARHRPSGPGPALSSQLSCLSPSCPVLPQTHTHENPNFSILLSFLHEHTDILLHFRLKTQKAISEAGATVWWEILAKDPDVVLPLATIMAEGDTEGLLQTGELNLSRNRMRFGWRLTFDWSNAGVRHVFTGLELFEGRMDPTLVGW